MAGARDVRALPFDAPAPGTDPWALPGDGPCLADGRFRVIGAKLAWHTARLEGLPDVKFYLLSGPPVEPGPYLRDPNSFRDIGLDTYLVPMPGRLWIPESKPATGAHVAVNGLKDMLSPGASPDRSSDKFISSEALAAHLLRALRADRESAPAMEEYVLSVWRYAVLHGARRFLRHYGPDAAAVLSRAWDEELALSVQEG